MKTIKVIHYPENGNKTTEIFEANRVIITEGYLPSVVCGGNFDGFYNGTSDVRTFGARMHEGRAAHYWVILMYLDDMPYIAGLNSKVYIMTEGKTVSSHESIEVEF